MDTLELKLGEILEKADYLGQRTRQLAVENQTLREEVAALNKVMEEKDAEMEEVKRQFEILRMAKNLGNEADNGKSEELKNRINEYIREIDQCLKLIGD